jgi:PadR family transcriptional regulator
MIEHVFDSVNPGLPMHRWQIHRSTIYSGGVTEQSLFILASLATGERHGYGIAQEARALSDGRVRLSAGTLYGALNRLSDEGLVEPSGERVVEGRRRRYYRLTGSGEAALRAEVERIQSTAATLGARLVPGANPA